MKFTSTAGLYNLVQAARRKLWNRTLSGLPPMDSGRVDPHGYHGVLAMADHGDGTCLRCEVFVKMVGTEEAWTGLLDVGYRDYERMPEYTTVLAELEAVAGESNHAG